MIVISLIGATLIARPPFIFGTTGHHSEMELRPETMDEHGVTPHQRIVAVGYAMLFVLSVIAKEFAELHCLGP